MISDILPSAYSSQIMALEIQISSMKENLEKEHEKWRAAQANYERQVCSMHIQLTRQLISTLLTNVTYVIVLTVLGHCS